MRKPKYSSLEEWRSSEYYAYRSAKKSGILPKICDLFGWDYFVRKQRLSLTLNECKTEALKYKTRKEWRHSHLPSYSKACREKWINELCFHMVRISKPKGYWTLRKCKKESLKYKSKAEWLSKHPATYNASVKNRWHSLCCEHMIVIKKQSGYWTLEKCREEALKYKTKKEWHLHNRSSYVVATRNKWIKECSTHMKKRGEK
jgi:hypothetical protein